MEVKILSSCDSRTSPASFPPELQLGSRMSRFEKMISLSFLELR
jgi:hypothetical protein